MKKAMKDAITVSHVDNGKQKSGFSFRQAAVSLLLLWGFTLASFFSVTDLTDRLLLMAIDAVALVLIHLFKGRKKTEGLVLPVGGALIAALILIQYTSVIRQALTVLNQIIDIWNVRYDDCLLSFETVGNSNHTFYFWVILVLAVSLASTYMVSGGKVIAVSVCACVFSIFSVAFGLGTGPAVVLLLLMGWLGVYAINVSEGPNLFKTMLFLCCPPVLLLVLVLILTGGLLTDGMAGTTERLKENVRTFRYGTDPLPGGDLTKEGTLLADDSATLRVTFESPEAIYLKGYVGSVYTGTGWETIKKINYTGDNAGILDWLKGRGLDPLCQYSEFISMADPENYSSNLRTVTVENLGASRAYVYVPEAAAGVPDGASEEMDWYLNGKGIRGTGSYSFQYLSSQPAPWRLAVEGTADSAFEEAENVYAGFAKEQYTQIDDEMRALMNEVFFGDETWNSDTSVLSLTSRIRTILSEKEIYMDFPQKDAYSEDKIYQFLVENHTGNSMSYASAAVMAFRSQGIPARYAEGYYLTDEEAEAMSDAGTLEVTLTGENAHAWAEIYMEEVGWVPIEVTPGYYNGDTAGSDLIVIPMGNQGDASEERVPIPSEGSGAEDENTGDDAPVFTGENALFLLLLILYILFALWILLEIQRYIRRRRREARLTDSNQRIRIPAVSAWIVTLLKIAGIPENHNKPMERAEDAASLDGLTVYGYKKTVETLQKVYYSECELDLAELRTLSVFTEDLEEAVKAQKTSLREKLKRRYRQAL